MSGWTASTDSTYGTNAGIKRDGVLFATPNASAGASAWSSGYESNGAHVVMSAGTAQASASAGSYTGVTAGVEAFKYSHENGEFTFGLAADTGAGIQNKSLQVKVLGCGFTVGDETGFSLFGSEIKAKNLFSWFS